MLLICAHLCLSVGGTSLPECSVCSACSVGTLYLFALLVLQRQLHQRGSILPRISRISRWLGCVIGGVGMAGMPYPPNLCASVPICGRLSLPEGSVCSACSVGPLSLFALLVLQRQLHQRGSILPRISRISRWLGCVIGGVGMAGMPYPPNLCASVPICGRHFSARRFCVFRVFCGTLSLFALLVHLWAAHLRWFPSAAQSDSVRHPIRLRSPPDQVPSAARCHK